MRAGVLHKRTVRRIVRHRRVRRQVTDLVPRVRVAVDHHIRISGTLRDLSDKPVAGVPIRIFSRSSTTAEQYVGSIQTNGHGRYRYVAVANSTRILRLVYDGTRLLLPSQREVTLLVPAASTIRARPNHVRNEQATRFEGRLRSLPAPAAGKLVELQVVLSGRWQTFRTVRTTPDGSWHVRYRFRRSCGRLGYRFRARLPQEAGYPFETGRTRSIQVHVRGAPCR
jgi:hypothetical protein